MENVGWVLLAALAIMWAAFLYPSWRRHPRNTVKDFERDMSMLADTETSGEGRWIVTPRKGYTFVGPRARAKVRARERRRRILTVLVESVALSGLIGLVPPLRAMWYATGVLLVLLGAYVWLLVSLRGRSRSAVPAPIATPTRPRPARRRHAADAGARSARPAYDGLVVLGDGAAPVVVRSAGTAGAASV